MLLVKKDIDKSLKIVQHENRFLKKKRFNRMILIKNAEIYTPKYIGKKDVLICGEKIECIKDSIENLPE